MTTWESNGHVTDDVTRSRDLKGQGRDPDMFGAIISKMAEDSDLVTTKRL